MDTANAAEVAIIAMNGLKRFGFRELCELRLIIILSNISFHPINEYFTWVIGVLVLSYYN
jgi:hypothetical protein